MVNLNFILDNNFLASYILSNYSDKRFIDYSRNQYKADIVAFQNLAFEKSKDTYMSIDGRFPMFKFGIQSNLTLYTKIGSLIDKYISELTKTKEFNILREQTEESILKIKNEWNKNCVVTTEYINSLGIEIGGKFNVYVTHPGLKAGNSTGNKNTIWAYQEYWPNYNTVYIWHEILHSYFEHEDTSHALIELITDEEMRIRLNGGNYPPFVGHEFLNDIKTKNLEKFRKYIDGDSKDIKGLEVSFGS